MLPILYRAIIENDAGEVSCTAMMNTGELSESESEAQADDLIDAEMEDLTDKAISDNDDEMSMEVRVLYSCYCIYVLHLG